MIIYQGGLNRYYARPSLQEFVERLSQTATPTLDGHLLDVRWVKEDRYRDGVIHNFYDLAFVDHQGFASSLSLRGDSAAAVSRKIALLKQAKQLYCFKVRFHFVAHGNRSPHVEVAVSQANDIKAAQDFLTMEWHLMPWVGV